LRWAVWCRLLPNVCPVAAAAPASCRDNEFCQNADKRQSGHQLTGTVVLHVVTPQRDHHHSTVLCDRAWQTLRRSRTLLLLQRCNLYAALQDTHTGQHPHHPDTLLTLMRDTPQYRTNTTLHSCSACNSLEGQGHAVGGEAAGEKRKRQAAETKKSVLHHLSSVLCWHRSVGSVVCDHMTRQ
jgi:hypothetical protein